MSPLMENEGVYKVAVIGSGNWGSVAAKIIASNTIKQNIFHDEVRMWVYEETFPTGEKLSETINGNHENCKYLPGINLGSNVIADPDLENTVRDADMLVFVTPHSYAKEICKRLAGKIKPKAKAISLIKGMEVKKEGSCMISKLITDVLGINCCVLMGANIANEIAEEKLSEATIGYTEDKEVSNRWAQLFATPYFLVSIVEDSIGVELCGTLKNVVAIAAGLVDGLEMGNNTKAAIIRIGLKEMRAFSKLLFPSVKDSTFFESCGVGDLIASCCMYQFSSFDILSKYYVFFFYKYSPFFKFGRRPAKSITENTTDSFKIEDGGRNRRVAEAFARSGGKKSFNELEEGVLQGQKLQGVLTAQEVFEVLNDKGWEGQFPFFVTVHKICTMQLPPSSILKCGSAHSSIQLVP